MLKMYDKTALRTATRLDALFRGSISTSLSKEVGRVIQGKYMRPVSNHGLMCLREGKVFFNQITPLFITHRTIYQHIKLREVDDD
jgi:hypothetical protein